MMYVNHNGKHPVSKSLNWPSALPLKAVRTLSWLVCLPQPCCPTVYPLAAGVTLAGSLSKATTLAQKVVLSFMAGAYMV